MVDSTYLVFDRKRFETKLAILLKRRGIDTLLGVFVALATLLITFFQPEVESMIILGVIPIKPLLLIIITVLFFYFVYLAVNFRWRTVSTEKEKLISELDILSETTNVFLIKHTFYEKGAHFLVAKKQGWRNSFFLPYKKGKITKEEAKAAAAEILGINQGKIHVKHIQDLSISEAIYTHLKNNKLQKFNFEFYHVTIHGPETTTLNTIKKETRFEWKTVLELTQDLDTMLANSYVMNQMTEHGIIDVLGESIMNEPITSNIDNDLPSNLKVIWNISKSCEFECTCCATHKKKDQEISFEEKYDILYQLAKIKRVRIDFSGGDPLYEASSKKIIDIASKFLNPDRISITTTGRSVKKLARKEKDFFAYNYDLTYDFPSSWDSPHRGKKYNQDTLEAANELREHDRAVNLHVPIFEPLLNNTNAQEKLIEHIQRIEPKQVLLMRLMPVGKISISDYPKEYAPAQLIQLFEDQLTNSTDFKIHCALRAPLGTCQGGCNMLTNKIGIDHLGNVYACAWAGYLDIDDEDNPFFLGNILQSSLKNILTSQSYTDLITNLANSDKNFCRLFSYCQSNYNPTAIYINHDPLSSSSVVNPDNITNIS